MMEVRLLPPRRHNSFLLYRMADTKFDEFINEHVTRWRDVSKLISALRRRFNKRKYPRGNVDEQQRLLRSVHEFLGLASNDQHSKLLMDDLNGRTRRNIRKSIRQELDTTEEVIDNVIAAANACATATDPKHVVPTLNSIRFNLMKTLVNVGPT